MILLLLHITIKLYENLIFFEFIPGIPLEKPQAPQWTTHNMSLWEDVILLSSDTDHQPLLIINQTGVYNASDIGKMENETLRQFQILKVIYSNGPFLRSTV